MAGTKDDWRGWLHRHGPGSVLFARQWTWNRADAEDAVQDGFLRFWRIRDGARGGVGYLYAAVRSAAIDLARSRQRRERREDRRAAADAFGKGDAFALEHVELAAAVQAALENLPPEQREVIVMKVWGNLSFAEIAEALDISANTAASRYRYALGKLENELAEEVARD